VAKAMLIEAAGHAILLSKLHELVSHHIAIQATCRYECNGETGKSFKEYGAFAEKRNE
jgi:hypothetical protein